MKVSIAALSLTFALLMLPQAASAQSFDCTKATTDTEHAICDSRSLSNLDVTMATLYGVVQELPMLMGARGNAEDAAKTFIETRDACGADKDCLTKATTIGSRRCRRPSRTP